MDFVKLVVKKFIYQFVHNEFLWTFFDATIMEIARYAQLERDKKVGKTNKIEVSNTVDIDKFIKKISPDLIVKHGVFKGMKYPKKKSISSTLFPKLLGSYEKELQEVLERICTKEYSEIINIGCAEGYYAVGLAICIPTATVYAYDVNEEAIYLCKQMAQINNVSSQLITGAFCDRDTLKSIPLTNKALIICDCEGYEKELFNKEIASLFIAHDLLIEIHDLIDINISSYIRSLFQKTHKIEVIQSVDDIKKAQHYNYKELEEFDMATRKLLLAERRLASMEWFYMSAYV